MSILGFTTRNFIILRSFADNDLSVQHWRAHHKFLKRTEDAELGHLRIGDLVELKTHTFKSGIVASRTSEESVEVVWRSKDGTTERETMSRLELTRLVH